MISSAGIPLRAVSLLGKAGIWREETLIGGRLPAPPPGTTEIRAAGHHRKSVDSWTEMVVLEPVALFRLAGPGVAARIRSAELEWASLFPSGWGWSFGPVSSDLWACALDVLPPGGPSTSEVLSSFRLSLTDSELLQIDLDIREGLIAGIRLPVEAVLETAPLQVQAVDSTGRKTAGVRLFLKPLERLLLAQWVKPWGTARLFFRYEPTAETAAEGRGVFPAVPLDRRYRLDASDPATGRYGALLGFRFEGHSETVVLDHAPLEVLGGFQVPGGWELPVQGTAVWRPARGNLPSGVVQAWTRNKTVELDREGAFRLEIRPRRVVPSTRPERFLLAFRFPRFRTWKAELVFPGSGKVDLGKVVLEPDTPILFLAPGHGIVPGDLSRPGHPASDLHLGPGYERALDVEDLAPLPGGRGALFGRGDSLEAPSLGKTNLLELLDGRNVFLERNPDGDYQPAPLGPWKVRLETPALGADRHLVLSLAWPQAEDVVWDLFDVAPGSNKGTREEEFQAPLQDSWLRWRLFRRQGEEWILLEEGSQPLVQPETVLSLP